MPHAPEIFVAPDGRAIEVRLSAEHTLYLDAASARLWAASLVRAAERVEAGREKRSSLATNPQSRTNQPER